MDKVTFKSKLNNAIAGKKYWKIISTIQTLTILLLAFVVIGSANNERTIFMPPTISKTFWIEDNRTSPEYLEMMAHFFAGLTLNTSPESVSYQNKLFLSFTAPSSYRVLKPLLTSDAQRIKAGNFSQIFFSRNIKIYEKAMTAVITGRKVVYVGKTQTSSEERTYRMKFKMTDGRIWITEFTKVHKNDPFEKIKNSTI